MREGTPQLWAAPSGSSQIKRIYQEGAHLALRSERLCLVDTTTDNPMADSTTRRSKLSWWTGNQRLSRNLLGSQVLDWDD